MVSATEKKASSIAGIEKTTWLHLAIILVAIVAAYSKIFSAPFSSWDDTEYVLNNTDISSISASHLADWCTRFYIGNYHPLTMLSYAVDFCMGGRQPEVYHITNILLHVANAVFVYFLTYRLGRIRMAALLTALIFAVHPVQTESVSWIAERKTLLCAFFYLLALLQYPGFTMKPTFGRMLLILLTGLAAMMSKGIGVTLPFALLLTHLTAPGGLRNGKVWLLYILLTAAAVVTGIVAIEAQAALNFLNLHAAGNGWESVLLAAYAYLQYIMHILLPAGLSVIYPYPETGIYQYIALMLVAMLIVVCVAAWRKGWKILLWSILFYTLNILPVLQIIQFGNCLLAERYLYIAGIGIIFPLVYFPVRWLQQQKRSVWVIPVYSAVVLSLSVGTFIRNDIWLSELNFYEAILAQFPGSAVAQYSLGALYLKSGDLQQAETYINFSVQSDPNNYKALYNQGVLYLREGKIKESLTSLDRCIALNPYPKAFFSRAMLFMSVNRPQQALADAEKVLEAQPENARAWYIKANCLENGGTDDLALECCNKAIQYEGNEPLFYLLRGQIYAHMKHLEPALRDMQQAIQMNPANGKAYYELGMVKYQFGQSPCKEFQIAAGKGFKVPAEIYAVACDPAQH